MDDELHDFISDLFHNCALTAFVEVWRETGQFPPDSRMTMHRANRLYEEELAKQNCGRKSATTIRPVPSVPVP